jgi:hypothetical protein
MEKLCHQFCDERKESESVSNGMNLFSQTQTDTESSSTLHSESDSPKTQKLSSTAILHYYRNFVFKFLSQIKYEEYKTEEKAIYNINLQLTNYQLLKLKQFSEIFNESEAGFYIQDATDILNNMFLDVEFMKTESLASFLKSILIDSHAKNVVIFIAIVSFI